MNFRFSILFFYLILLIFVGFLIHVWLFYIVFSSKPLPDDHDVKKTPAAAHFQSQNTSKSRITQNKTNEFNLNLPIITLARTGEKESNIQQINSENLVENDHTYILRTNAQPCPIWPSTLKGFVPVDMLDFNNSITICKDPADLDDNSSTTSTSTTPNGPKLVETFEKIDFEENFEKIDFDPQQEFQKNLDPKGGGHFVPPSCVSRHRVAIIVPFRNRYHHLKVFLWNMHPFLQRQMIQYSIFVIDQVSDSRLFNRAMLFNVGFVEASKVSNRTFDCYIFHDVDLIPENDHNLYNCPEGTSPRHMSVAVDTLCYRLPYRLIFGGIGAMTNFQFIRVNGFSNKYWGWGGEDDDMSNRIQQAKMTIFRPSALVARYKMLKHGPQKENLKRFRMLKVWKKKYRYQGLNSLKYKLIQVSHEKLYTHIKVKLLFS